MGQRRRVHGRVPRALVFCAAPQTDGGGVQRLLGELARSPEVDSTLQLVMCWPDTTNWPQAAAAPADPPGPDFTSGATGDATTWYLRLETGPGPAGRAGLRTALRALRDLVVLGWRLAVLRPDVVNLHFPRGQSLYFVLLKPLFRFRLLLSFHGSDLNDPPPGAARLLPWLCRRADAATVVSEQMRADVARLAPGLGVTVVPNGVDTDFWSPADAVAAASPPTLIAVGRLTPVKGFDVLLRALAHSTLSDVRLDLAGEGRCRGELETRARELGVSQRVRFLGHLSPVDLRAAYRASSLFVLSSHSEGMPLTLIEALACGLPAVATDVGAVGEILDGDMTADRDDDCGDERAGILVAPDDPAALATAIARIVTNPTRRERSGSAGRSRALDFTLAACLDAYVTEMCALA